MIQLEHESERRALRRALTPPELKEDLSIRVLDRISHLPRQQKPSRSRVIWLGAASLLVLLLAGWWFLPRYKAQKPGSQSQPQVLVESALMGQSEAFVFEFSGRESGDAKFFWIEPSSFGQNTEGGS